MRTYVATYKIYTDFDKVDVKDVLNTKNIKYKFVKDTISDYTLCYLTIVSNNRLQMRKYKKDSLRIMKGLGKVELIVGVG